MAHVSEIYGSMVFNEHVMKERLPSATYKSLTKTIKEGKPLDIEVANVVAHAMKEWAIEHGATHYTHWFQPLSGITSEKHDSFLNPVGDGTAIMAVCVPRSRLAATPHGILPALHSSRTKCCASLPHSAPTPVKHSTRKPRFSVP